MPTEDRSRGRPQLVSVVVPARDAAPTLTAQLDALAGQTYDGTWEVVVVDNGSTDGTGAVVDDWLGRHPRTPAWRGIVARDGAGAAHARNAGARVAAGDLLAFCDADDVVAPGWLAALVEASAAADAVVGVLALDRLNPGWLAAGQQVRARPGTGAATDRPPPRFGLVTEGSNMAVWRAAFEAVGGFDEGYRGGSEDKDLGYRLRLAGWALSEAPGAVVHRRLRRRWPERVRQSYRLGREDVRLYCRFEPHGYPRRGLADGLRTAGALVRRLPECGDRGRRVWWWKQAARLAGRARGSLLHRRLYL